MLRVGLCDAIERRAVTLDDREYELRLVGISEDADGGATVAITISGMADVLRFGASKELLDDPIALRLRAVFFLRRLVSRDHRAKQRTE
jgi:hypothetical protein